MTANLEEFGELVKQSMNMPYGKTNYTVRDLMDWIRSINLTDVKIEHVMWEDCFLIGNMKNGQTYKISRFQLEDSATPRIEFIKGIAAVLNLTHQEVVEMIRVNEREKIMADTWSKVFGKDYHTAILDDASESVSAGPITGATYIAPVPANSWVTIGNGGSGGAGGAVGALNNWMHTNYNLDGTIMHDMPELEAEAEQQLQRDLMRNRLFNKQEREELEKVKQKVLWHFKQFRLNEEMSIPFKFNKLIIAGGCFASFLNGEEPRDFDVFLLEDEYNRKLAKGVADSYKSEDPIQIPISKVPVNPPGANTIAGYISLGPKKNDRVRVGNSNYMQNDKIEQTVFFQDSKFQYITTQYKTREELIGHFDFKHCCVSYSFATDKLYITREVYDLIKSKKLVQNGDRIPAGWRFDKFQERGWKHEPLDVMFL
jgi:hypothetical protein